jgi:oligoendopeptidase F
VVTIKRTFLLEELFTDVALLETKFRELTERKIRSVEDLEKWIQDESRLLIQLNDWKKRISVEFKCDITDKVIKERYKYSSEVVEPLEKKYKLLFNEFLLNNEFMSQLNKDIYGRFINLRTSESKLLNESNIPLETEEQKLIKQYYSIIGSIKIEWSNEQKTRTQVLADLNNPDRKIREMAWRRIHKAEQKIKPDLDEILNQLIKIRHKIAINAGCTNYIEYTFKKKNRIDYNPDDCNKFYEAVKRYVVPIQDSIRQKIQQDNNLESFRPWDLNISLGKEPTVPFSSTQELIDGVYRMLEKTDQDFASVLKQIQMNGDLDLETRDSKAHGGFNASFFSSGLSFIFLNVAMSNKVILNLVHEVGHSIHTYLAREQPLFLYHQKPMEASEFASHSMELLCLDQLTEFFSNDKEYSQAICDRLIYGIRLLPHVMLIDQFQHWMYKNPEHRSEDRDEKYRELRKELSGHRVNWDGLEKEMVTDWLVILHIFAFPFYFIEYAIAEIGALQTWKSYKSHPAQTLRAFKHALSLGNSKSLNEIFLTAGIKFDFSDTTIKETFNFVTTEMEKIESHGY